MLGALKVVCSELRANCGLLKRELAVDVPYRPLKVGGCRSGAASVAWSEWSGALDSASIWRLRTGQQKGHAEGCVQRRAPLGEVTFWAYSHHCSCAERPQRGHSPAKVLLAEVVVVQWSVRVLQFSTGSFCDGGPSDILLRACVERPRALLAQTLFCRSMHSLCKGRHW